MSLVDELTKLEDLRRRGVLSDTEFNTAKQRLLNGPGTIPATNGGANIDQHLANHLDEIKYQNDIAALDREWEIESRTYMTTDRYGRSHVPTAGMARGLMIAGPIFGGLWLTMAIAITSGAPDIGPFSIAKYVFPLFGVFFIAGSLAFGVYLKKRARQYQDAFARYKQRRQQLTGTP